MSHKFEGLDAAIIALHRHQKTPVHKRRYLNNEGVGLCEQLLILTMQVMLDPASVTTAELIHLNEVNRKPKNG
jgi:hypothetical protein